MKLYIKLIFNYNNFTELYPPVQDGSSESLAQAIVSVFQEEKTLREACKFYNLSSHQNISRLASQIDKSLPHDTTTSRLVYRSARNLAGFPLPSANNIERLLGLSELIFKRMNKNEVSKVYGVPIRTSGRDKENFIASLSLTKSTLKEQLSIDYYKSFENPDEELKKYTSFIQSKISHFIIKSSGPEPFLTDFEVALSMEKANLQKDIGYGCGKPLMQVETFIFYIIEYYENVYLHKLHNTCKYILFSF